MLKLCRISVVGFHLLLLTHIINSYVLLSANIEDVKKIARKFVSDSLAEKIVDFIAKATKNITDNEMASKKTEAEDSGQVSAENSMYNAERARNDESEDNITSAEDESIVLAKDTIVMSKNSNKKQKGHKEKDYKDKELEYKAKEDKGTGYKDSEYKDKELGHKNKQSGYSDKESEYKNRESDYTNKEIKDKKSDYKDKESEYKKKESEYSDKEPEYKNKESGYSDKGPEHKNKESEYKEKEYKDRESGYKEKESDYNDKDDKETEYTKMSKPNKSRKRAPKPLHRRSRYIDQGKTKGTEKSDVNIKEESDYKTLKEPAVTYVEDDDDITTPETKTKRENLNSNIHHKVHTLDSVDDSTVGTPKAKAKKDEKLSTNEKATAKENEPYINKNTSERAINDFHGDDIGKSKKTNDNLKNKDTEMAASKPLPEKYDGDNNIIPRGEKITASGFLVNEKDPHEERWWEKELPTRTQDVEVQAKGKSWF